MKKRTAFESALVRRIPQKGDFLRYAAYEMGLEALRRRRVKRLSLLHFFFFSFIANTLTRIFWFRSA